MDLEATKINAQTLERAIPRRVREATEIHTHCPEINNQAGYPLPPPKYNQLLGDRPDRGSHARKAVTR